MRFIQYNSKSILEGTLVYSFFTFLQPAISFLLLPYYLKFLTTEEYGVFVILTTIVALSSIFGGLNSSSSMTPLYFKQKEILKAKNVIFSSLINFNLISNLFLFLLLSVLGYFYFPNIFSESKINYFPLGFFTLLTGLTSQIPTIFYSYTQNQKKIIQYTLINTLGVIIFIIIQIIGVFFFGLIGLVIGRCISNILMIIIVIVHARKEIVWTIDRNVIRISLNFSIPLIPFLLIFWIGRYIDRFFLEKYVSLTQVGVYGLTFSFAMLVTMASQALASAIQPFLFESYDDPQKNERLIGKYNKFYLVLLSLFCLVLLILVSNLAKILPKNEYFDVVPYFWIAILPTYINGFQYVFFNVLIFKMESRLITIITVISVSCQVMCMFFLIEEYKILGAILSSIIGNVISFVLFLYFGIKRLEIKYEWSEILFSLLLFVIPVLIIISLHYCFSFRYESISFFCIVPITIFIFTNRKFILSYINGKKLMS